MNTSMGQRVRLLGWRAEGVRCPDHEVRFEREDGSSAKAVLFQMPNGTGKTTTLALLRAALSGEGPSGPWTPEEVRALRKRKGNGTSGEFNVRLMHNDRLLTMGMRFDFAEGKVRYFTTTPSGMGQGFQPPRELARYLQPKFVRLFVFDGELAQHLLDREFTDAEAAIDELFQLRRLREMEERVAGYWSQVAAQRGASEQRGLSRRKNRVDTLKARLDLLERQCAAMEAERAKVHDELLQWRGRFDRRLEASKKYQEDFARISEDLARAEEGAKHLLSQLVAIAREPNALNPWVGSALVQVKEALDRAKLPENAAREFFEELAAEAECICGRPIDAATSEVIRIRAKRYLGSADVAMLNEMKGDIAKLVGQDVGSRSREAAQKGVDLKNLLRRVDELTTDKEDLAAQAAADDPEMKNAKDTIERLTRRQAEIEKDLEQFSDSMDDDDSTGIHVIRRRLKEARAQLAEITGTLRLKSQVETIVRILNRSHSSARQELGRALCQEANGRIEELMPFNRIRISGVDKRLVLAGQEAGSAGETLSVSYAFLATLFDRAEHQLPMIVDSPVIPIDKMVRKRVAQLIPKLSKQFVAFMISSEHEAFLDPLVEACGNDVQYVTLYGKDVQDIGVTPSASDRVVESTDGIMVEGADFFRSFHRDKE